MSARIERAWGTIFGSTVKRKETTDRDPSQNQGYDQGNGAQNDNPKSAQSPDEQPSDASPTKAADRSTVEKAIVDLRSSASFEQTGLRIELVETIQGMTVRLIHPTGALVKSMSGDEFIKLRDASAGESVTRGKILDQKF